MQAGLALSYGLAEPDSDVYSLALVFFERLSGLRPSDLAAGDAAPSLKDRLADRWSQIPGWVITATAELFERALAPGRMAGGEDPGSHWPSAESCAARLRAVIRLLHASEAQTSGRLLDGRYRVRRPLGEGASGRTYLVEDTEIDNTLPRTFVVKILNSPGRSASRLAASSRRFSGSRVIIYRASMTATRRSATCT